jgi:hypothetical protein
MGFLQRLFGASSHSGTDTEPHSRLSSAHAPSSRSASDASPGAVRRELLRVALQDTLRHQGIPTDWIGADVLAATSRTGQVGLHWRLSIKHWDPRLMIHGIALQNALITRVLMFDPVAETWLMGVSWQYALDDESRCPGLPHPGSWTGDPRRATHPVPDSLPGGSADVIQGPVTVDGPGASDLARLMAIRDADFRAHAAGAEIDGARDKTQPMYMKTEPDKLDRE